MFDLRDYQSLWVDQTRDSFRRHRRVLMVAPTGSGKAVFLGFVAHGAASKGKRVYLIVHRAELVEQLSRTLRDMDVRHGRIQPGWTPSDWPVQVAMIQTLSRRMHNYAAPDLLFFDEAHHAVSATYQKIADRWAQAKILGVTATPLRLDGRGLGTAFDDMVRGPGTRDLIDAGWLADFDYLAPPSRLDPSRLSIRHGDYAIDELAAATDKPTITGDVIEHYKAHLDRKPTIVFCVRVDHAERVSEQARAAGIAAVSVDGTMSPAERAARIGGLANGNTELLTSCDLVGEGLDIPAVAGAILLRRTKSLGLYLQWIGRTLRLKRDASKATILDHVGCIHEHGMPDAPRVWTLDDKKRSDRPGPTATCEKCFRVFAAGSDWKTGMECAGLGEAGCILTTDPTEKPANRSAPTVVAGALLPFTRTPPWADGIDILLARGPDFAAMLGRARTYEQVDEIRKARGYSPMWTRHIMQARRRVA